MRLRTIYDNYEVSDTGRVFIKPRVVTIGKGRKYFKEGGEFKYITNSLGYKLVDLSINGKRKRKRVHRLVAEAFIPNPLNKPNINHIDSDPSNNNLDNLEWVTQSENIKHSWDHGNMAKHRKLNIDEISSRIEKGEPISLIAGELGVSKVTIYRHMKQKKIKRPLPSRRYNLTKEKIKYIIDNNIKYTEAARSIGCTDALVSIYVKRYKERGDI